MKTDWEKTGQKIGSITNNGESGGTVYAQKAFEEILGKEWIEHTVDTALYGRKGSELAMNCLRLISSELAVDYAYKIYKTNKSIETKNMAVWLIKNLAVRKSFQWIEEFLNDKNVIGWGIGVLDQLLWKDVITYQEKKEEVDFLLELAIKNSDNTLNILEQVNFIREFLEKKNKKHAT